MEEELRQRQLAEKSALNTVMTLLDSQVSESDLISAVRYLTPQYYRDVTEERGLMLLCGYPICGNRIKPINHKQKYHISTQTNKVYDVSERKYFCSPTCYKASKYLENQVSEEPLWTRGDNFTCVVELLQSHKSADISDQSVLIHKDTVSIDSNADEIGVISPEGSVDSAEEDEHISARLEEMLLDDRLSDDSSDEELSNQNSAESLLQSRKDQRLNIPAKSVAENTNQPAQPMLLRQKTDGSRGRSSVIQSSQELSSQELSSRRQCVSDSSSPHSSANTSAKHQPSANASATHKPSTNTSAMVQPSTNTSATPKQSTNMSVMTLHEKQKLEKLRARNSAKSNQSVILLDACPPAPGSAGRHRSNPLSSNNEPVEVCLSRLTQWFSQDTRELLFTEKKPESASIPTPSDQQESSLLSREEVELTQPNKESVGTARRGIVFRNLLKSCEKVGSSVPENVLSGFRDKLTKLIKSFRLNSENISAHPIQWNITTLVLIACSYHSEKDVMMTVAEEVSQLTHGSHKYIIQQLHTFINRQQSDCLVTLN